MISGTALRRPGGPGIALLAALGFAAGLIALLLAFGLASSRDDLPVHPWWDLPSLAPVLLAPYVLAARAVSARQSDRALGGLLSIAAGLGSLVPAYLTVSLGPLALVLAVLGLTFVAIGLTDIGWARLHLTLAAPVAAAGIVGVLFASPLARFAEDDERCVRVTRYADGRVVEEPFTAVRTNGLTRIDMGPPNAGVVSERAGCTSDYATTREALSSTGLTGAALVAGLALPLVRVRPARFAVAAPPAAALALVGLVTTAWAAPGVVLLTLAAFAAFLTNRTRPAPSERN